MNVHAFMHTTALAVTMTILSPGSAFAADTGSSDPAVSKAPLKLTSLPIMGQALTPTNLTKGVMNLTAKNGTVVPSSGFEVNGDYSLNVLDIALQFSGGPANYLVSFNGSPAVKVPQKSDGIVNIPIPVGDSKKSTLLSIPVISDTKTGYKANYRSGAVAVGKVEGEVVYVYDDNFDGRYTTSSDMISAGSGVVYAPIGKWLPTKKYLLSVTSINEDGSGLEYAKATVPSGKLDAHFINPYAEAHVVFAGPDGINAITTKGPIYTLPGDYRISYGLLINKNSGVTYAGIVAGASEAISVKADGAPKAAFGGPFTGDLAVRVIPPAAGKPQLVVLDWPPIRNLQGIGGEQYVDYRFQNNSANVLLDGKSSGNAAPPC